MKLRWTVFWLIIIGCLLGTGINSALGAEAAIRGGEDPESAWVGKAVSLQGIVLAQRRGRVDWQPVNLDDVFSVGDRIRVEANSRAGIVLSNDAVLRLDQNTTLVFTEIEHEKTFILRLLEGAANFFSHRPRSLKILTPFVNGVVEGTEFYVRVDDDRTRIDLFAGRILAENPHGSLTLVPGQGVVAADGSAPQRQILVQPRDSVQWALYYPPILDPALARRSETAAAAQALFDEGRTQGAIDRLESVDTADRDAGFFVYRAGLLLHVGRVDAAGADLRRALELDPYNGNALALQSVIAVVQHRTAEALELARLAVERVPESAAVQIALSYACQAEFDLSGAVKAAEDAVGCAPDSGLARARLAELRMSTGEPDKGIQDARKAVELDPDTARAHTILGFAYLTRIETEAARKAFERAIALDSAAPLPRLGLGLAYIRDGNLETGRSEIEIAAGLDPGNALIRSYLGKAYFDEKRGPRDAEQFEIAKSLDPNDPTPWFYDAIRKQTENRPVEALQDLQKSIELNDNRAVYRSRLMLDQDLAARSAAVGQVYNDLSFQELALREGARSLGYDPTDYSAHRLLADIYAGRQRYEIARVSELLQSQLLQPINITPVQPQSSESTLIAPETNGPQTASWNEFNPLFARNRTAVNLGALLGGNGTAGNDISLAGLYDQFSYSLGQHHYETDGFRPNNGLEKDIAGAFAQIALSPDTSIQAEYRYRDVTYGDIALNWDPEDYSDTKQVSRRENIPRLGIRHSLNSRHHFIGSLIYNQTDYALDESFEVGTTPMGPVVFTEDRDEEFDSYHAEGQYIFRSDRMNLVAGAGHTDQNLDGELTTTLTSGPMPLDGSTTYPEAEVQHTNGYAYAFLEPFSSLDLTLGLSADSYDAGEIDTDQINPKIGLLWQATQSLTLRGAAFRVLKRTLVTNQTIEPTQIAGFTQFFDDPTAADAKRYGIGLDYAVTPRLSFGAELAYNDMTRPLPQSSGGTRDEDYEEYHHRSFLYWALHPRVAVSTEYLFDSYRLDNDQMIIGRPIKLKTHTLPLTLSYFHPNGLYAKARGIYINQELERRLDSALPAETLKDDFAMLDFSLGYRLPNRYGLINLSMTNVFDTHFNYQDMNFLTPNEQDPGIKPERQVFLSASFSF